MSTAPKRSCWGVPQIPTPDIACKTHNWWHPRAPAHPRRERSSHNLGVQAAESRPPLSRGDGGREQGVAGGLPAGPLLVYGLRGPAPRPGLGSGAGGAAGAERAGRGATRAQGPGRGGRASGHYLLPKAPLRRRRVHPGPGPRGAGSDSRAAGRAPRVPRPNRGNRWPGRSRWSVAWSVPRRGPGPEPRGPLGPVSGAAVAAARAFRAPPPPLPSCSEAPGGPRDAAARDPGSGCPRRACSKTLFPRDRGGVGGSRTRLGEHRLPGLRVPGLPGDCSASRSSHPGSCSFQAVHSTPD